MLRTVLLGAVESTRTALERLIRQDSAPSLLVTIEPEQSGRHSDYADMPDLAEGAGVDVYYCRDINSQASIARIRDEKPDYVFVIGWSQICRRYFLDIPCRGIIGYHPSALPKNRGRAVIPWTILQGLTETAGTLFWIDEGMDTGDILLQRPFAVDATETAATLYAKHMLHLGHLLSDACVMLERENPPRMPQRHALATYCKKRTPSDGLIDWQAPARDILTLIRATTSPYPGAFTFHEGRKLTIWDADLISGVGRECEAGHIQAFIDHSALIRCGDGMHLLVKNVQLEGEDQTLPWDMLRLNDVMGLEPGDMRNSMRGGPSQ